MYEELIQGIVKHLAKGDSENDIKKEALKVGYTEGEFNRAYAAAVARKGFLQEGSVAMAAIPATPLSQVEVPEEVKDNLQRGEDADLFDLNVLAGQVSGLCFWVGVAGTILALGVGGYLLYASGWRGFA